MSRDFYKLSNVICDVKASAQLSGLRDAPCWQRCHPAQPQGEAALTLSLTRAAPGCYGDALPRRPGVRSPVLGLS